MLRRRRQAGLRRHRRGHVRAEPADPGRGADPEYRGRRARACRRADHARCRTTCGGSATSRGHPADRGRRARARLDLRRPVRRARSGMAAAFSFYPTKVVTCGEGGMILTPRRRLADEARIYRDQGKGSFGANHHVRHGYAWRMSEQNAVTGLVHLRRMEQFIERRREVAAPLRQGARRAGLPACRWPSRPAAGATSTSTSRCCPPGVDRAWFKQRAGRPVTTSGWPARSTTCRCTASRCSPSTPGPAPARGRGHVRAARLPAGPLGHDRRRG